MMTWFGFFFFKIYIFSLVNSSLVFLWTQQTISCKLILTEIFFLQITNITQERKYEIYANACGVLQSGDLHTP